MEIESTVRDAGMKEAQKRIREYRDNPTEDRSLYLSGLELQNIPLELNELISLNRLDLSGNKISKIENLDTLTNLSTLFLFNNQIQKIENLDNLTNLSSLYLSDNQIQKIENLDTLTDLSTLYLSDNQIQKIENLDTLTNLSSLYLSNNQFQKIENLDTLTNLSTLYLRNNQIQKIESVKILYNNVITNNELKIYINDNPFLSETKGFISSDYKLGDNHRALFIRDYENAIKNDGFVKIRLPNKVILFGNSASGKTSLFDFLYSDRKKLQSNKKKESTETLEIRSYKKEDANKPYIFYYDFGGQDYYHSSYKLFTNLKATYLLVWSQDTNYNHVYEGDDVSHYNFDVPYWLGNIRYLTQKESDYSSSLDHKSLIENAKVILIQNKLDLVEEIQKDPENKKELYKLSLPKRFEEGYFDQSFDISLWKEADNEIHELRRKLMKKYFMNALVREEEAVADQAYAIIEYTSRWRNLTKEKTDWNKSALVSYLQTNYDSWKVLDMIDVDRLLRRFHDAGMLLWYESHEVLHDQIFIYPKKVQKELKAFLKKIFKNKVKDGLISQEDFESSKVYKKYGALLRQQQLIFQDISDGQISYVVPQALPMKHPNSALYQLAINGLKSLISLRFLDFMPIGIMNRLIIIFGKDFAQKCYTRHEIICSFKGLKIRISCNFIDLIIDVDCNIEIEQIDKLLVREIYQNILKAYYDKGLKEGEFLSEDENTMAQSFENQNHQKLFSQFKMKGNPLRKIDLRYSTPEDLQISIDKNYFVTAKTLEKIAKDATRVNVVTTKYLRKKNKTQSENLHLDKTPNSIQTIIEEDLKNHKEYPAYIFNPFMSISKPIAKKLFISYAHEDTSTMNRLLTHLKVMERNRAIEIWQDGLILPGESWDERIKKQIRQCDIFVMLVSPDFLASNYIWDEELKLAKASGKHPFPILVSQCDFANTAIGEQEIVPKDSGNNLKAINQWEHPDSGIFKVVERLKTLII